MITFNPIIANRTDYSQQKNCYVPRLKQELKADVLSFKGIKQITLSDINKLNFPRSMYLSKKALDMAENYNESLFSKIGKIMSKRLDYMGLTQNGVLGSFSYAENKNLPAKFVIHEKRSKGMGMQKLDTWELDWSPAYKEIREVLDTYLNDPAALKKEIENILVSHKIIKA